VGKTTLINSFASSFDQYIYLNLENKEDAIIFQDKNSIEEVVDAMFFLKDKKQNDCNQFIFQTQ